MPTASYQRHQILTLRDSQIGDYLIQGWQWRLAMPVSVPLRPDFYAANLRLFAKCRPDSRQTRRLLALAAFYDGMSRSEAAASRGTLWRGKREIYQLLRVSGTPTARALLRQPVSHLGHSAARGCQRRRKSASRSSVSEFLSSRSNRFRPRP
jgi:hypothetical protein